MYILKANAHIHLRIHALTHKYAHLHVCIRMSNPPTDPRGKIIECIIARSARAASWSPNVRARGSVTIQKSAFIHRTPKQRISIHESEQNKKVCKTPLLPECKKIMIFLRFKKRFKRKCFKIAA